MPETGAQRAEEKGAAAPFSVLAFARRRRML
jgi:hypothetical protein